MTNPKPPTEKKAPKAAKAIQRAIKKNNPAKESPTVGKPVIIDPADDAKSGRKQSD